MTEFVRTVTLFAGSKAGLDRGNKASSALVLSKILANHVELLPTSLASTKPPKAALFAVMESANTFELLCFKPGTYN